MNRGPISEADRILVKRYLVTQMVLDAFERDKRHVQTFGLFKSPQLYTDLIDKAMDDAIKELTSVRKAFRNRGIKVYDEHRTAKGVEAKYMCRGYHSETSMLWSFITAEAIILMRLFLGLDIKNYTHASIPEEMREEPVLFSRNDNMR